MYDLPPIRDDYFKNRKNVQNYTKEEIQRIIDGGRVAGKIKLKLQNRKIYENNGKSPRPYFPFNPFKY